MVFTLIGLPLPARNKTHLQATKRPSTHLLNFMVRLPLLVLRFPHDTTVQRLLAYSQPTSIKSTEFQVCQASLLYTDTFIALYPQGLVDLRLLSSTLPSGRATVSSVVNRGKGWNHRRLAAKSPPV